jgi:hypothetical protein
MDERDDESDRFRRLPEPIRLSQTTITYAAVPTSLVGFGDGCAPFGGPGGQGDGD